MMHQTIDSSLMFNDRPQRDTVIQKDDVISLKIDLNLLSVEEFIQKYCEPAAHEESHLRIVYRKQ